MADEGVVSRLDLIISLAQGQIAAQLAVEAGIDTKAAGLIGLSGALFAGDIAAKSLVGRAWWLPFIGFGVTALVGVLTLFTDPIHVGPRLEDFYRDIERASEEIAKQLAIEDLLRSIRENRPLLRAKEVVLRLTLGAFFVTVLISAPIVLITRG